jgi:hypothetical protein
MLHAATQLATHWSMPSSLPISEQVGLLSTVTVTCAGKSGLRGQQHS